MPTFNMKRHLLEKRAAEIANGNSVSTIPDGVDSGQGIMLSDGNPQNIPGEDNKKSLRDIVGDMVLARSRGADEGEIARIGRDAMNAELPEEFQGNDRGARLMSALGERAMEGGGSPATDPETGEPENGLDDLVMSIIQESGWDLDELMSEAKDRESEEPLGNGGESGGTDNGTSMAIPPSGAQMLTAQKKKRKKDKDEDETGEKKQKKIPEEDDKADKKKGNPFKVLMGRVQKLLDHGIDGRSEVARTILRQKDNQWERDTIEEAYQIVKERNVKEERRKQRQSFNMARHLGLTKEAQAEMTDTDQRTDKRPSVYDIERPVDKMGFFELISRMRYLEDAANSEMILINDNMAAQRGVDKGKARSQAAQIKAELGKRGYDGEMLEKLFGIPAGRNVAGFQGERQPDAA